MVMAKEKRLGLRQGSANLNEPMDTIFVKAVHEGMSAHAAGLETGESTRGDRFLHFDPLYSLFTSFSRVLFDDYFFFVRSSN